MRLCIFLLAVLFSLMLVAKNTEAKVLPQATKAVKQTIKKSSSGGGIGVTPRLRSDKKALTVYFSNLQNAKSVSYMLIYNTAFQQEGAGGTLTLGNSSNATQELLFGTCSKNVCRYHTGVNNARLEVTYTTKVGKKYLKKYKIKV